MIIRYDAVTQDAYSCENFRLRKEVVQDRSYLEGLESIQLRNREEFLDTNLIRLED